MFEHVTVYELSPGDQAKAVEEYIIKRSPSLSKNFSFDHEITYGGPNAGHLRVTVKEKVND